jgi:pyruvate dehydrogenase E2 component (dihydrolipoamide acetyltransferase)
VAEEFRLPDIGEGLIDAEIVCWLVPVGGVVAVDEAVVEVATDKSVVEIPSPFAGTVVHHGASEGARVEVGEILFVIGEPGERWPAPASPARISSGADAPPIVGTLSEEAEDLTATTARPSKKVGIKAMPAVRHLARQLGVDLSAVRGTGRDGRVTRDDVVACSTAPPTVNGDHRAARTRVLSPVVRRLAEELGVDASAIAGTGPGGRVTRDDVTGAARRLAPTIAPALDSVESERRPMSALRRAIAANVARSWSEIPQVTAFDEVDATRLLALRSALGERHGCSIPIDALVVATVLPALRRFPEFNATVEGDDLVIHRRHDIGIAVGTPDGLLVAVVRGAGTRGVLDLAAEIGRLGNAARARSLGPSDLSGQTFTVSNIGAVGGGHGTPIVPAGTTAILSVGRAAEKPIARDGRVVVAPLLALSLSYDHRVIDGAAGRQFLAVVTDNIADPALCLA